MPALRLKYITAIWKGAEMMMLAKPGQPPDDINSYRPISLFVSNYLLFEKVLSQRLKIIINNIFLVREKKVVMF